jgi:hypothetical protein
MAAFIDAWYRRNGYIFARVSSRSPVRTGRLQLIVSEPRVAPQPVALAYYAPVAGPGADTPPPPGEASVSVPPPDDSGLTTRWRRFRARWDLCSTQAVGVTASPATRAARLEAALWRARDAGVAADAVDVAEAKLQVLRRRAGLPALGPLERMHMAGGLVAVGGATRGGVVSRALHLRPGEPFRWDSAAWEQLRRSGLFEQAEVRACFVPPPPRPAAPPRVRVRRDTAIFVQHGIARPPPVEQVVAPAPVAARHAERQQRRDARNGVGASADERVSVVLSVIERDGRPHKPSQHCRVEPGIALAGGRLAGELALFDHNLGGRNQQLRVDVSMRNGTELRASLHDPRLGSRFGFDARVFQRGLRLRPTQRARGSALAPTMAAAARAAAGDESAEYATQAPEVGAPLAGVDVSSSGRAWHGTTIGFGASAEVVPTATPAGRTLVHETPFLLNARFCRARPSCDVMNMNSVRTTPKHECSIQHMPANLAAAIRHARVCYARSSTWVAAPCRPSGSAPAQP